MIKEEVQIYHHLGLGDHIICNGLIRELCKNYEKVYCFVKKQYFDSIAFMYRDQPRIELIPVKDDNEVPMKARKDVKLIKVGFEDIKHSTINFEKIFYKQLGFDFSLRWNNFYIERDYEKELKLFHKLNLNNTSYIFVHDDPTRVLPIDLNKIQKDLKLIKVSDFHTLKKSKAEYQEYNLFHWIHVLQNAKEIHCMDSSFKCLIESLPNFDNTKLFYHHYVKGLIPQGVSSMKKDWVVIDDPSAFFKIKIFILKFYHKVKKKLYTLTFGSTGKFRRP